MTYPPPGGGNPQQYNLQPEPPQQPSDPYSQGYNQGYSSAPPPAPGPGYYDPAAQYGQPPPNMTPPVGVQPGYPQGAPSPLPPQVTPQKSGGNLGIILVIVVGLVVVLGVAAVLLVPGMLDDGDDNAGGGDPSESASASEEPSQEPSEEPTEEPTEDTGGDDFASWGPASSSDDYDENTPEGAAITWKFGYDEGDTEAMESVMCSSPSDDLQWEYDYAKDYGGTKPGYPVWGMSREADGKTEAWAGWTYDDAEPVEGELDLGYIYEVVEEDGAWKVCGVQY